VTVTAGLNGRLPVTTEPTAGRRAGWLVAQLPRAMAQDPFLAGLVALFEDVAGTVQHGVDSVEHHLDTGLASPAMLRYLAAWLGVDLDPAGDRDRQRELLHAIGPLLGWRGTRRGLEGILRALTGSRVRVLDTGGVWTSAQRVPGGSPEIVVELDHLGDLNEAQVRAFIAAEIPVGTRLDLRIGRPEPRTRSRASRPGAAETAAGET
jgi:phage tail-like protein